MRRCVWSRNLNNEEAMTRVGSQRHRKKVTKTSIYECSDLNEVSIPGEGDGIYYLSIHVQAIWSFAGSIPDGVIGFFHWHNAFSRTMALGLTQPLTEMITRNISWGVRRPVRRADSLTTFMCRLSWNLGASPSWSPQGLSRAVMEMLYLYLFK